MKSMLFLAQFALTVMIQVPEIQLTKDPDVFKVLFEPGAQQVCVFYRQEQPSKTRLYEDLPYESSSCTVFESEKGSVYGELDQEWPPIPPTDVDWTIYARIEYYDSKGKSDWVETNLLRIHR